MCFVLGAIIIYAPDGRQFIFRLAEKIFWIIGGLLI